MPKCIDFYVGTLRIIYYLCKTPFITIACLSIKFHFIFSAGDSFKSLEDDAAPKEGVGGGGSETKDGVGGTHLKDNENGTVEKDSSTANAETPTKSSKLSIFGSKDKNKDKADKNAIDNNSKMPLGLGGKPKTGSSDGFDGK